MQKRAVSGPNGLPDSTLVEPTTGSRWQQRSATERALRRLARHRLALVGAACTAVITLVAVFAPVVAASDPTAMNLPHALRPPSAQYPLGTDGFGRDVVSRLFYGARTSLAVGLGACLLALLLGLPAGLTAGYVGGRADVALMRIMDAVLAFPGILLALVISATLGPSVTNVVIALGIVYSPGIARLVRGQVLAVKHEEYVTAARALGASWERLLRLHIVPNIISALIVLLTFTFARSVVAEASMSFLGVGTQPPHPSWGLDVSEARRFIREASWLVLAPSGLITITVLSINFVGDGLRDAFDPQQQDL